jgi:hypothetical protein
MRRTPACGRHDSIASQIHHHLPVVIEAMRRNDAGYAETGHRALAERALDGLEKVFLVDGSDRLVGVLKRGFQIFLINSSRFVF